MDFLLFSSSSFTVFVSMLKPFIKLDWFLYVVLDKGWPYILKFIPKLPILFCWSMCVFM
jgi:hypothetical protein